MWVSNNNSKRNHASNSNNNNIVPSLSPSNNTNNKQNMFSRKNNDDDHLYDFNTNMDSGMGAKVPSTGFRGGTAQGRPLMSSLGRGPGGGAPMSRAGVPGTAMNNGSGSDARPMTSVSGAGYKANKDRTFDPLNIGKGPAPPLAEKADNSPEDKAKELEKGVHRLMEETAKLLANKDLTLALEKAKEAAKAERSLCKFRESNGLVDQINLDLTYAICFNLANAYFYNKMYDESLNAYQQIVKNKQYPQSGRLRINMGNIYYEQKKYPQAIKMYRMALDQIPAAAKELRCRILRNIGNAFVKLQQFQDAIDNYDLVMTSSPDIQTSFNLILCLYARGDKDKIKRHFLKMLGIPVPGMTDDDEEKKDENTDINLERLDTLKEELNNRIEQKNDRLLAAARLIAPVVDEDGDWEAGYKWLVQQLRNDHELVASKLEIDLSMQYMQKRKFDVAIEVLKSFERKESKILAMAGTNLSFIYFLESDYQNAEKYADIAIRLNRYNAQALVNKGNCLFVSGDYVSAKAMYLEAVGVEADCVEAIYNLGLVNLKLGSDLEAKQAFNKLHSILPKVAEALFQIGYIIENMAGNSQIELGEAAKTYENILKYIPADPNLYHRLGLIHERLDDENYAKQWHEEAHRIYPVNLNVISWLGVWYVKREMYEEAIKYFETASDVQPGEVKWRLMVASCHRRNGDYFKALELYQQIYEDHPENQEALQYLEALCKDLGRPHDEYSRKLEKVRRSQPQPTGTGQMTRAGATQVAPQRSERPKPERPSKQQSQAVIEEPVNRSPLAAPRANGQGGGGNRGNAVQKKSNEDDDDFGDTDVGSLLG